MYRGRLWTMRQYSGFGSAEATNRRFRYLLSQGQTGLSVAFDLPTQMGYDSDHPKAAGEVGKVGVAVSSVDDMALLLDSIPLGEVSTSMTINATAPVLLALYVAVAARQGVAASALRGTVQNDILKEYIARGTYIYPPGPSLRLALDLFEWCAANAPKWNPISVSGYHLREAGCTAAQELAFTFGDAIAYLAEAKRRGLDVARASEQMSFFFCGQMDLFEEVAKFRAARKLWHSIVKERFGVRAEAAAKLRFHTQTAGFTLTAQEPENNLVRVALEALGAVLGGTQSLHTNSMDEALGLPTEKAALLALRTQQIIAEESGIPATVDPLGGSYHVEELTDELERLAREILSRIDDQGGMVTAVENGWVQREIAQASYEHSKAVESRERIVVGVNAFAGPKAQVPVFRVDREAVDRQLARLKRARKERDASKTAASLDALRRAARGRGNLFPPILAAVSARCTLGEISDALRDVFGEYKAVQAL
jgi:methylmalonyl-CoA mutase N-terminal domain/subunit